MKRYREDANGYVKFTDVPLSKCGVFPYLGSQLPASFGLEPDKVYQLYRPESELNNPETIESLKGVPWFSKHAMVGDKFGVNAEEVGIYGSTGDNIEFRDGVIYGNLNLFAKTLKESIKAGLKDLSCGFTCIHELVSGVAPDGKRYDVIQREIRGNHLASVPEGRMGSEVSVSMDSLTFAIDELDIKQKSDGGNGMNEELKALLAKLKEAGPSGADLKKLYDEIGLALGIDSVTQESKSEDEDLTESESEGESEDEDVDPEKKPEFGMDAAAIGSVVKAAVKAAVAPLQAKITKLEGSTMDESAVMAALTERQEMINQVAPLVGAFDYKSMNRQQVAKYAARKLGISCDSGAEVSAVKAFLQGRQKQTFTIDEGNSQDAAVRDNKAALGEMGL